jgi:hypothetical protein
MSSATPRRPLEFIEQRVERVGTPSTEAALAVEWRERTAPEDGAHPRNPEVMLGFDEVRDDLAWAPGTFAVVVIEPRRGESGELGAQHGGSALQDGEGLGEYQRGHVGSRRGRTLKILVVTRNE